MLDRLYDGKETDDMRRWNTVHIITDRYSMLCGCVLLSAVDVHIYCLICFVFSHSWCSWNPSSEGRHPHKRGVVFFFIADGRPMQFCSHVCSDLFYLTDCGLIILSFRSCLWVSVDLIGDCGIFNLDFIKLSFGPFSDCEGCEAINTWE